MSTNSYTKFTSITPPEEIFCKEKNLGHRAKIFSTVAGNNNDVCYPFGLSLDRSDNIYIADAGNGRILVFHHSGYYLRTIGTSGRGTGELFCPRDVAVDQLGRVYIADSGNHRIQVFSSNGEFLSLIGRKGISAMLLGSRGSMRGSFNTPCGVAVSPDGGQIVVSDRGNHRIQVFFADGTFSHLFGSFGHEIGQFCEPWGLGVTPDEHVVIADNLNNRLQVFTIDGEFVRVIDGDGDQLLNGPSGVAISNDGSFIAVSDTGNNRVVVFTMMGEFVDSFNGAELPRGVAIDSLSRVIVADTCKSEIQCLYWKA